MHPNLKYLSSWSRDKLLSFLSGSLNLQHHYFQLSVREEVSFYEPGLGHLQSSQLLSAVIRLESEPRFNAHMRLQDLGRHISLDSGDIIDTLYIITGVMLMDSHPKETSLCKMALER